MKLKKTILSVMACVLSFVMLLSLAACGPKEPEVTALTLSAATVEIATGESQRLTVTAKYSDDTTAELEAKDVEWSSSTESVATVSRGVVSAKSKGTATVTAKVGDVTATCAVTVYSLTVEISGEGINDGKKELARNDTLALTATVKKDGAVQSSETVKWESDNTGVATVTENGLVTAVNPGTANITATRTGGKQSAKVVITVTTPEGYELTDNYEQNKAPADTWAHWSDKNYNWANSTVNSAYIEEYEKYHQADEGYSYIGANKMNINFQVDSLGGTFGVADPAIIQLFYRSSTGNEGQLAPNHNYSLKLKVVSSVAGIVTLNAYDDVDGRFTTVPESTAHEFTLVAGEEKQLEVTFRHGDSGAIYADGIYTNVESAVNLLLGLLGCGDNMGKPVQVTVYDVQFKDLGESTYKWQDNPEDLPGYVPSQDPADLPDLSGVNNIALGLESNNAEMYTVTTQDDGKTHNVVYTNTVGESYANLEVDITGTNAAECNTFAVTVTNNAEAAMRIRFDINGQTAHGANNVLDIVQSAVATTGVPSTNLEWGGTDIEIAAGATVTLYLTYDAATESGAPQKLLIYFHTHVYQDGGNTHSGNVTLSNYKFANVAQPVTRLPKDSVTATGVDIVSEGDKVFYVLTGTSQDVEKDTLDSFLNHTHFDLQQCGGAWKSYDKLARTATVNDDGTWTVKFDITELPVDGAAYTSHFTHKEPDEEGYAESKFRDVKLTEEQAVPGKSVTLGGKKYSISNVVGGSTQDTNWGCVSIKVELVA